MFTFLSHIDSPLSDWLKAKQIKQTTIDKLHEMDFDSEDALLSISDDDMAKLDITGGQRSMLRNVIKERRSELGGYGIFGVELFIKGDTVWFSEVSPRPHDTGMVTMISQDLSQFALPARAILGLPIPNIAQKGAAASSVILVEGDSKDVQCVDWSPDGRRLVAGYSGGAVRLWELADGKVQAKAETGVAVLFDVEYRCMNVSCFAMLVVLQH